MSTSENSEEKKVETKKETEKARPARLTLQPQFFRGGSDEMVDKHLRQYNSISNCNGWSNDMKLQYFPHFLGGTAKTWYYTLERQNNSFKDWEELEKSFKKAFESIGSSRYAEQKLRERVQKINESPEDFVYGIIELCVAVDENMSEQKKVSILLEKMNSDYMRVVNQTHPETVEEVLKEMRTFTESEMMTRHRYMEDILTLDKTKPLDLIPKESELNQYSRLEEKVDRLLEILSEDSKNNEDQKCEHCCTCID